MERTPKPKQLDLFDDWLVIAQPVTAVPVHDVPDPPTVDEVAGTMETIAPSFDESRHRLALALAAKLNRDGELTSKLLTEEANRVFGGTQADGTYSPKDAYDAMEAAFNLHLTATESADWIGNGAEWAQAKASELTQRIQRLPTQTRRDPEMDEFQQFSTPPALAFVANWVANIRPTDRMLEPSAGTGDLAIWSQIAGADIVLNELAPRRHALLSQLFPDATLFRENAEQLDNVLPRDTVPSVIVMNPPFSSTAGRVQGQRDTANGARHIEQALRRLEEGGRLVAIVGQGMAADRPAFRAWWRGIEAKYTVRANIGIDGREYAKFGTSFDNQILVIDKTGPTIQPVLTGQVASVGELPALLETIRHDRQHLQRGPAEPTGRNHSDEVRDSLRSENGTGGAGPDPRSPRPESSGDADDTRAVATDREAVGEPLPGHDADDGIGTGSDLPDRPTGDVGGSGGGDSGGAGSVAEGTDGTGIAVEATANTAGEFSDSVFARYTPQRLRIPEAHAHPGKLVQSAAMSAVEPPAPSYTPALPPRVVRQGLLSIAQLESIVYAGQAHSELLPNGARKGFFIGDGTGVGKGREISGIILDNLMQGRKKAVWVSFNEGLINDARRDYSAVGGDPDRIFFQGKTKAGNELTQTDGILFTTYSTLRGGEKKQATDQREGGGKSRLQQMVDWLGKDFGGVIAFDEAHSMGNAIAIKGKRGVRKPSQQALAGINLQRELPNARVIYVSATGATEVSNLSYADRLGLWGEGTPFADVNAFINGVSAGGIAAMELISRDMKAMGMYLARSLSYDGVTYERMEHTLSELQEDIYNELAGAWQIVLQNVETALEITQAGSNGQANSAAMAQFWGAHQRFFNQIITAMQTPAVIDHIRQQFDAGHAAVIQIVNTNEAAQERIIADATANDAALEDLDFTPRQMLMDYVRNGFPVAAFEESTDDNGNKIYVPVRDSEGNQVFDREAITLRDALLSNLQHIRVPENPLDSIINAFGPDTVAEITGRGRRFIQSRDDEGNLKVVEEKRGKNSSRLDAELFQADKKKLLVFSGAGGTGYSFHADNTAANTRKRIHYILQPGWRADAAVQGFGRTHRTNQATEPHYVLPTTNLKAQKRFVSSIARRLDQLGALTRGQRQATSQGMFTAADNLESEYAKTALYNFFVDLYRERTPLSFQTVTHQMGLNLLDQNGAFEESKIPDIPQFLNRLLSLKTDQQNAVFDEFETRLVEAVEYAKQRGLYDQGLQTLRALNIHKTRDEVAYEDAKTGAQTRYVELAVTNALHYLEWDEIAAIARNRRQPDNLSGWFVSEHGRNKGEVFFLDDRGQRLDSEGNNVRRGVVYGIKKHGHRYIDNADVIHRGWEYRVVNRTSTKVTLSRPIDEAEAERLWKAQVEAAPKTETTTTSMLVGVILPIWDRVEGAETIYRLQTDDGEQLLGRLLGPNAAKQTLKNLGLDSSTAKLSPGELFAAIQAGQRAVLSNGWEISLSTVNREDRIEIKGKGYLTDAEKRLLTQQGAFVERINWAERVFIPAGDSGLPVFERVTSSRPVVDLFTKSRADADADDTELGAELPRDQVQEPADRTYTASTTPLAPDRVPSPSPSTNQQEGTAMAEKKSFAETVAEKLIAQLQAGVAPWQRPWESAPPGSTVPMNPTTGKRYKGINALYLMAQEYTDQRWLTYKQVTAAGAQVRKDETGTPIQYWKFTEEQTRRDEHGLPVLDADGNPEKVTVKLERPRVFFATVFNAEQIDGLPPLERKPVQWDAMARAEHILKASGVDIRHVLQDRAFYRPATDTIHLPDRGQFETADRYYATALHELAHASGHESRLARDLSHPFGSEGYAKEELRAEIASMIVGDELGIGHDPEQHASYVQSWIKVLQEDPLEIFRAAADAEKIQDYVIALEQQQIQERTHERRQTFTVSELTAEQYQAMHAADEAFQRELIRVYGEDKAGDARYQYTHDDPEVQAAGQAFRAASAAWRTAVAEARKFLANETTRPDITMEPPMTETNPYQAELGRLLKLSTVTPSNYVPSEAAKAANHAAVFVGDDPAILCGPADDDDSVAQAYALASSPHLKTALRAAGRHGEIVSGVVAGTHVNWQTTEAAVVSKPSGQVEHGGDDGPLIAIVLNDPNHALTTNLCVTTETARIFDPNAPALDDGAHLSTLARGEQPAVRTTDVDEGPDHSLSVNDRQHRIDEVIAEIDRAIENTWRWEDQGGAEEAREEARSAKRMLEGGEFDEALARLEVAGALEDRYAGVDGPSFQGAADVLSVERLANQTPPASQSLPRADLSMLGPVGQEIAATRLLADQVGVTTDIERLAFNGLTASQIAQNLEDRLAPVIDRGLLPFVRQVRASLGIPPLDDPAGFAAWRETVDGRLTSTQSRAAPLPRADVSALGPVGEAIDRSRDLADRLGLTVDIERLAFDGMTATQIANTLESQLDPVKAEALQEQRDPATTALYFVRQVRTSLGIPPLDDTAAYESWRTAVADRLSRSVTADGGTIDYEAVARIAREEEERIKADPNSTDEDIVAAREARKTAEAAVVLNDPDMQRRIAEFEERGSVEPPSVVRGEWYLFEALPSETLQKSASARFLGAGPGDGYVYQVAKDLDDTESIGSRRRGQNFNASTAAQMTAQAIMDQFSGDEGVSVQAKTSTTAARKDTPDRLFIDVPYKQKDEAKALGARWDRQEQSWYVPAGVNPEPFEKWTQKADSTEPRPDVDKPQASKRQYLAVPYSDRNAAKEAGALWDKGVKSWYAGPSADMAKLQRWVPENVPAQQGPALSPSDEFAEALRAVGAVVSGQHPIMDGQRHRIAVEGDKKGEHSGFYVAHVDGHPAGYLKNNRTGVEMKWKSKGYALDPQEKAKMQAEAGEKLRLREAEQAARRVVVTEAIRDLLAVAPDAPRDHTYLENKQARSDGLKVVPSDTGGLPENSMILIGRNWKESKELREQHPEKLVFTAGDLLLPAQDIHGQTVSVQSIQANGAKRFAKDSAKLETFNVVGGAGLAALEAAPVLIIGEGYATADTLSQVMDLPVVSAFDSGNLPHVAKLLHERFPDKSIIIAGDDDLAVMQEYGNNPGREKAEEAAKAVNGHVMFPIFAPGEQSENPKSFTDFNDLAVKSSLGAEAVERQVRAVVDTVVEKHRQDLEHERAARQEQVQEPEQRRSMRR